MLVGFEFADDLVKILTITSTGTVNFVKHENVSDPLRLHVVG